MSGLKLRLAILGAMMSVGVSGPSVAQDTTPYEECILQCAQNYPLNSEIYRLCRQACGTPELVSTPTDAPVVKLD
jgi:hypothetical protein